MAAYKGIKAVLRQFYVLIIKGKVFPKMPMYKSFGNPFGTTKYIKINTPNDYIGGIYVNVAYFGSKIFNANGQAPISFGNNDYGVTGYAWADPMTSGGGHFQTLWIRVTGYRQISVMIPAASQSSSDYYEISDWTTTPPDGVTFKTDKQPPIANGSVTTAKLADGAVTSGKIASGAVTASKCAGDVVKFVNGKAPSNGNVTIATPSISFPISIANGGTGATTAKGADYNLHSGIVVSDTDFADESYLSCAYKKPNTTEGVFYKRTALHLWNYIKSKISSVLGLTSSSYKGEAAYAKVAYVANKAKMMTSKNSEMLVTDGISVVQFAKTVTCLYTAGTLLSRSDWAWANSRKIVLNNSISIDTQRYSCLVVREGNISYNWNQHALLFIPTYADVATMYLVQMTCADDAAYVSTKVLPILSAEGGNFTGLIKASGGIVIPTSAPSSPVEGEVWIE